MDASRHWLASGSTERVGRMLQAHRKFFRDGSNYCVPAIRRGRSRLRTPCRCAWYLQGDGARGRRGLAAMKELEKYVLLPVTKACGPA